VELSEMVQVAYGSLQLCTQLSVAASPVVCHFLVLVWQSGKPKGVLMLLACAPKLVAHF
jgi:hypothetical protein